MTVPHLHVLQHVLLFPYTPSCLPDLSSCGHIMRMLIMLDRRLSDHVRYRRKKPQNGQLRRGTSEMDALSSLLPPAIMASIVNPMAEGLSSTYEVVFGDTPTSVFLVDYLPILYVTVLPLLNVFLRLFCVCDPGAVNAMRWPPRLDEPPIRSRGQRIVRRAAHAISGVSRMANAAALSASHSKKSSKNKGRTNAALTAQMASQYNV